VDKDHEESAPPRGTTDPEQLRTGGRIGSLRKEGEMEGRKMKVFGVVMALLLVFSFAATFSVSSTVSAGTQKWTQIAIPGTDDMQLAPDTDIGSIAVSPDGQTLFAAVHNEPTNPIPSVWNVYKSVDGGFTWKVTGMTAAFLSGVGDATDIVAIGISPDWENDDIIVVATQRDVYYSDNRGKTFATMNAFTGGVGTITSMNIGLDEDGDATYVIGTNTDVWIISGFSGWVRQNVNTAYIIFSGVLSVSFSPNYGEDGVVFAIINGQPGVLDPGPGTHLRAESDITVNNWGSYIQDGHFIDEETSAPILAASSCMAFAEDYNSAPAVFVGLTAGTPPNQRGDAFCVDLVMGAIGTSNVNDLNIRGSASVYKRTNVYSIAVSGERSSAFILVGLRNIGNSGPMASWMGQVHYSQNAGESWLQSYKPPSGMRGTDCTPIVVMAPDFADSGIAYCSNGYETAGTTTFSGFYVSTTEGTTWNGRGLLELDINSISDIVPSPDYDNDSTLFMVTRDTSLDPPGVPVPFGFLWETKDGGSTFELILGMTLSIPLPGVSIDKIEIPATYPDEPSMFVTGPRDAQSGATDSALIARSTDEGNLWATTLLAPYNAAHLPLPVQTWVVTDKDTLILSNADKIFKTTDMGAHWYGTDDTEIAAGETVVDMKIFNDTTVLVGTNQGHVYMCENWETDFSFVQVGITGPGVAADIVHVEFDTNFDENGFVYAGVNGGVATDGVWRIDANSNDNWDQIYDRTAAPAGADVLDIDCDGNGIVWAILTPLGSPNDQNVIRSVNPNAALPDNVLFERVDTGDGLTSTLSGNMDTAPTQTYVFAVGGTLNTELWAYIDTLIKPTLITPTDGTTAAGTIIQGTSNARVSLMWEDMPKAQWYDYQVAYDTGFGSIATSGTIEGTQAAVSLFLGEKFYWRVRVNGSPVFSQWSEIWSFTTPLGPASAKPVCLSPTEGITGVSRTPALQWSSAVEATGFELMVAANCDWSNAIVNLTGSSALGPETAYQITSPQLAEGTNYCWKVRAINSDTDTMSPWSDTGTFTTLVVTVVEKEGTPMWVWVVIALSAVLLVGVVVLIVRTRRPI